MLAVPPGCHWYSIEAPTAAANLKDAVERTQAPIPTWRSVN